MNILMKVTSRERPKQLIETIKSYIELATNPNDMVWLLSFDSDDESCNTVWFRESIQSILSNKDGCAWWNKSSGKINAINRDVELVTDNWDILLNISDDQRPIVKGYDDVIRNAMPSDLDASIWHLDGQPRVNTQEIIGRNYYNRFNYIYNPVYKSLFCDNEATEVARILGKQIKSNQQIVRHLHPAWCKQDGFSRDALYDRNDKFWNEDQNTFNERKKINFGL